MVEYILIHQKFVQETISHCKQNYKPKTNISLSNETHEMLFELNKFIQVLNK